ncbi:MAG: N-acetylmuramoyl-L-alanine amidase [Candidatus Margulisbacteria bacterium]|nr:N-acetylmuramoyl-L-alanine amidase [Candidatus Margulisiibacteriota bacterium]
MRNILLGLLLLATAAGATPVEINQIDQFRDRGFEYLDIYTTGFSSAKGLLLENKLYIDFPDTAFSKAVKIMKKKSKRIANVEISRKDPTNARLIITLNKAIDYDIVNVFGRNKTVIEISDRLDNILAYQFDWENKNVKKKGAPLKPVKFEALAAPSDISLKGKTIILDPGHGGDDPGAFSASGVPEKNLTLKTAQATARLLREAGATVYLTRDEDRRSNLKDVVEFANKEKAGIFISIHYNSTNNSGISGTETYYYNPVSRAFAESMHEAIVRGLRRRDRGLHRVRFYTVKYTDMPSVLLEPAYLSNSDENNLANSASFREEVAESIVKGVKNYFRSKLR